MTPLSSMLPRGVRRLFRLPRTHARMLRDTHDEIHFHFEMRMAELRARGLSESEAEAEAVRRFGDTAEFRTYAARRAARQARWRTAVDWLDDWAQDVRFAARQFKKHVGFTALALVTLALGIGANTAIFSVVHRLLLAPLPYPDGNRIVMLTMEGDNHSSSPAGRAAVKAWRARAHSLETIAAVSVDAIMVQETAEQDTVDAFITSNYLRMLGVRPALGREFTLDEERPGRSAVAMITYGLWQRVYGGRADVLGSSVHVEGRPYTIVGVTPPDMSIPMSLSGAGSKLHEATPSIWLPASLDSIDGDVFARLRPGVSARQASRELQAILESEPALQAKSPRTNARCCAGATRAQDLLDPNEARAIEVLFVAVGVLLLIACANVANLLMARAWTRRREFAVRVALGAGRGRLTRLVLTESVALALAGGLLGVGVAWQTLRIIIALRPPALANLAGGHVEATVLLWSVGISVLTGILFGSAPALFAGARSVGDVLRSETRAGSGDVAARRIRSALIVAEIALSLVLLVGAGLLVRSFVALQATPLGFDAHNLVAVDVIYVSGGMTRDARRALMNTVLERFRVTPGVTEAAIGTMPGEPYGTAGDTLQTEVAAVDQARSVWGYGLVQMTPNYFHVTRMSLIEGRLPDYPPPASTDVLSPAANGTVPLAEVVVNREMAHRLWPDGHAIGARLRTNGFRMEGLKLYTVVGVVEDFHIPGRRAANQLVLYRSPVPVGGPFVARISGSALVVAAALRRAVSAAAPKASVYYVTIGDDYLRNALAPTRFAMALLVAFSVVALFLSAIGLYGVIAYAVSQRTREIGIRVALGAEPGAIVGLVAGSGLRLAAGGVLIGAAVAAAVTRGLSSMLYGVSPGDPMTLVAIALLVGAIALLASYVPARRALRIDPTEALRAE